jgi:hypothetical protein
MPAATPGSLLESGKGACMRVSHCTAGSGSYKCAATYTLHVPVKCGRLLDAHCV